MSVGHSEHTQTCPKAEERSVFCIALATQLESYLNVFQKLFIDLKTVWGLWLLLLFASLHHLIFKKLNKHFAEEQNNWSHTCGFPDLFYMCMQCSITQNMFKSSVSNHLKCCGQDQSPTKGAPRARDHITHWTLTTELGAIMAHARSSCNRLPQKAEDSVWGPLGLETLLNLCQWWRQQPL